MPTPGSPEWHARLEMLLAGEALEPEGWWYLSFADADRPEGTQFLGACVIKARGMTSAVLRARELKINPGGEVMAFPIPHGTKMPHQINVLLSKEQLGPGALTVGELEDAGIMPGRDVEFSD